MTRLPALPPSLTGRPFSVAEATQLGVSDSRMRGRDLSRPFHGVRAPAAPSPPTHDYAARIEAVRATARAYLCRAPDHHVFTHQTAAAIIGMPIPGRLIDAHTIHVSTVPPHRAPRAAGVVGHQIRAGGPIFVVRGLPVPDPARIWCQLGAVLGVRELVAAGDFLLAGATPMSDGEQLDLVLRSQRHSGARLLREALTLIRPGVESARESFLRLAIVDAGLPEPEINQDVYDERGNFVARLDMLYRSLRIGIEYDGEQHRRDVAQYQHDILRLDRLAALGWRILRVTQPQMDDDPAGVVRRIVRAVADASANA